MRKQIIGWSVACALTTAAAVLLGTAACRDAQRTAVEPPPPRDPAAVSDLEIELILNRLREGDLHALRKDMDKAQRAWGEARAMGEGLWPIHEGLGDSLVRVELHEEAAQEYRVAEELVPEGLESVQASIRFKRAGVLAELKRIREAVEAYLLCRVPLRTERALAALAESGHEDPVVPLVEDFARLRDPRAYLMLAGLHTRLERKADAALALANYCVQVAPWDAARNMGVIEELRKHKRWDEAIEVCRAWVTSTPEAIDAYRLMGDIHREAGRESQAYIAYTSIVDVRPGDAGAHRMLGGLLLDMHRPEEAIRQYEAARRARPEDRETYLVLEKIYRERGELDAALPMLEEYGRRFGLTDAMKRSLLSIYRNRLASLKKLGDGEGVRKVRRRLADLGLVEDGLFDVKILMSWDEKGDVDLHVRQPDGEHVFYDHKRSSAGGVYHVDDQSGNAGEIYTMKKAVPGTYRVSARLFAGTRATVKFTLLLFEDTPREERRELSVLLRHKDDEIFLPALTVNRTASQGR